MNRLLALIAMVLGLLFLGLATLNSGLLVMTIPLVIYMLIGMLNIPSNPELEIRRTIHPERADNNTHVRVVLLITNLGEQLDRVIIQDVVPNSLKIVEGETSILLRLPQLASAELSYLVRGERGYYRFRETRVKTGDTLGICSREKIFASPGHIFVLPASSKLKKVFIRPRQTLIYSGVIPSRQSGSAVEFFGVRGYQPGDPLRRINWKASARYPEAIFSNEFRQERVADIRMILDARRRSEVRSSETSLFEHSISATAALAQFLLNNGNRVALLVYGKYLDLTHPGYGKIQYEKILRSLARAQIGDSPIFEKLDYLPDRFLPVQAQIILISPLLKEDIGNLIRLRARGNQVMVISPDPIHFESREYSMDHTHQLGIRLANLERKLMVSKLYRAGITYINWSVDNHLDQVLHLTTKRIRNQDQSMVRAGRGYK